MFYEIIILVCSAMLAVIGGLYAYRAIFLIIGLFRTKRFEPAKTKHKYGIVVAARNEEAVIGNLLESIEKQTYPSEFLTVFVVADNCTDKTAAVAKRHGVVCYERFNKKQQTKGYALKHLFECIERDYSISNYEGFFIFDADNLLANDYIEKMNDAFDSGEKIITSYRNSKNFTENAISAGYAFHWIRTACFENRGRSVLKIPVRLQGTGFLFSSELVKDGWKYTSLTEDRAFTSDAIINKVHITYNHDAVFFDEQPNSLKIAARQRLRWAKGHLLAFKETTLPLLKNIFAPKSSLLSRIASFDMITTNFPAILFSLPLNIIIMLCLIFTAPQDVFANVFTILADFASAIPLAAALYIIERKRLPKCNIFKLMWLCTAFPLFEVIGDAATILALFKKIVWKPIPHKVSLKIEEMSDTHKDERQIPQKREKSGSNTH